MKRTRTTISTIHLREVFIVKNHRQSGWRWCEECAAQVQMVTPEVAAILINEKTRSLYRRVEEGRVHFAETATGDLLLCLNSLNHSKAPTLESFQKILPTLTGSKS